MRKWGNWDWNMDLIDFKFCVFFPAASWLPQRYIHLHHCNFILSVAQKGFLMFYTYAHRTFFFFTWNRRCCFFREYVYTFPGRSCLSLSKAWIMLNFLCLCLLSVYLLLFANSLNTRSESPVPLRIFYHSSLKYVFPSV